MAKKITKETIEQLIVEELENLSEEELNEINPFAGLGAGIRSAAAGVADKFQTGRAPAIAKAIGVKYLKKTTKLQNQLEALNTSMKSEVAKYSKNKAVKAMLEDAKLEKRVDALAKHITQMNAKLQELASGPVQDEQSGTTVDQAEE